MNRYTAALGLADLLFAYVVIGEPLLGLVWHRRLVRHPGSDPRLRARRYWTVVAWQWAWVAVIALIALLGQIPVARLGLAPPALGPLPVPFMLGFLAAFALGLWLRQRRLSTAAGRAQVLKQLQLASGLVPQSSRERRLFVLLALTAGICEELLYRGFLIGYLAAAGLGAGVYVAALLAAVPFGLAHAYQGLRGMAGSALFGLLMGLLLAATGSLLLPVVIHVLNDLRLLWLPQLRRPGAGGPAAGPAAP